MIISIIELVLTTEKSCFNLYNNFTQPEKSMNQQLQHDRDKVYEFDEIIEELKKEGDPFFAEWGTLKVEREIYTDNEKQRIKLEYTILYDAEQYFTDEKQNMPEKAIVLNELLIDYNITKEIYCSGWIFRGEVQLNTLFEQSADFSYAFFIKKSSFPEAEFKNWVNFKNAQFNDEALFEDTSFHLVNFDNATFNIVKFIRNRFQEVDFNYLNVTGNAVFHKFKVRGFFRINDYKNSKNNKETISFEINDIEGKIQSHNSDLHNFRFNKSEMSNFDFLNEKWGKKSGRLIIGDEKAIHSDIPESKFKKIVYHIKDKYKSFADKEYFDKRKEQYANTESLYAQFANMFNKKQYYYKADKFAAGKHEMRRLQRKFPFLSWEFLYKITGNYGLSWWIPLVWISLIFAIFSFVFCLPEFTAGISSLNEFKNLSGKALKCLIAGKTECPNLWFWIFLCRTLIAGFFVMSAFAIRRRFRNR